MSAGIPVEPNSIAFVFQFPFHLLNLALLCLELGLAVRQFLCQSNGGRVFVIFAEGLALRNGRFQPDTRTWPEYAVAHVRGTALGVADFGEFQPTETRYAARGPDDFVPIARDQWKARRLEEQADALMKLPDTSTNVPALPGLCAEPGYAAMRIQRITVADIPGEAQRIRKTCGLTPDSH